jgi:hypothetical protein
MSPHGCTALYSVDACMLWPAAPPPPHLVGYACALLLPELLDQPLRAHQPAILDTHTRQHTLTAQCRAVGEVSLQQLQPSSNHTSCSTTQYSTQQSNSIYHSITQYNLDVQC